MAENVAAKIGLDDMIEAAAAGALRALNARDISAREIMQSGFKVNITVVAGGDLLASLADRVALNPQPLPPVAGPGVARSGG